MVTVQELALPVQAPLQPENWDPLCAAAVSVTFWFARKVAEQVLLAPLKHGIEPDRVLNETKPDPMFETLIA